jgi:hypothetical protein
MVYHEIRAKHDASLQFDFVCRSGRCGNLARVSQAKNGFGGIELMFES